MIYRLAILNGDRKGQFVTVPEDALSIGRGPDCGLCLNDAEVAMEHAIMELVGHGLRIRDQGSMGKVLVNQHAVRESALKHGDIVEIGHTRMLVQAVVEAEVRAAFDYATPQRRRRSLATVVVLLLGIGLAGIFVWRASLGRGTELPLPAAGDAPVMVKIPVLPKMPYPSEGELERTAKETAAEAASVEAASAAAATEVAAAAPALVELPPPTDAGAIGLAAAEPPPAMTATPAVEGPDPYALAQAMVDDKVQGMMMEAHVLSTSGRLQEADELLRSVIRVVPDYAQAYVERAWLCEERGMLEPALGQWEEVLRVGGDKKVVAQARERLEHLRRAQQVIQPKFAGRVRVQEMDQKKFPESPDVREMRLVTVSLASPDPSHTPDARAVRVDVQFFDRDRRTGSIRPTKAAGEQQNLKVNGPWQAGEMKTVTASYVVSAALAPGGTRGEQFYGYVVRVYHFGALQDESAEPAGLLALASMPASAVERSSTADSELGAISRNTP